MTTEERRSIKETLLEKGFSEAEIEKAFDAYLALSTVFESNDISPCASALRLQIRFVDHGGESVLKRVK